MTTADKIKQILKKKAEAGDKTALSAYEKMSGVGMPISERLGSVYARHPYMPPREHVYPEERPEDYRMPQPELSPEPSTIRQPVEKKGLIPSFGQAARQLPMDIVRTPLRAFDFIDKAGAQILNFATAPTEALAEKIDEIEKTELSPLKRFASGIERRAQEIKGEPVSPEKPGALELAKEIKGVIDTAARNWSEKAVAIGHPIEDILPLEKPGLGSVAHIMPAAKVVWSKVERGEANDFMSQATIAAQISGLSVLAIMADPLMFLSLLKGFKGKQVVIPEKYRGAVLKGMQSTPQQSALKTLGLRTGVSDADILKAHKDLIKKAHPDKGGNQAWAAAVNDARDVLIKGKAKGEIIEAGGRGMRELETPPSPRMLPEGRNLLLHS